MSADTFELKTNMVSGDGLFSQTVMNFAANGSLVLDFFTTAKQLLDAFWLACATDFRACLSNNVSIKTLTARHINNGGGATAVKIINAAGTVTAPIVSMSVAANLAWGPNVAPFKVGHTFVPGVPTDAMTDDDLNTTGLTRYGTLGTTILAGFTDTSGVNWEICIYNRKTDTPAPVQGSNVKPKVTLLGKRILPHF